MDGLLVVDKPVGPTSHDVVTRVRRLLRERRVGHTGTLDPLASGVLPLVVGRATRLARFLSASEKAYEAVIRLGAATDTYDREGRAVGQPYDGVLPGRDAIERALDRFRGTFMQQPPAYSAKKVDGVRSYAAARAGAGGTARAAAPVEVTAAVDLLDHSADLVTVRVTCSSGFYVRSLAHELGQRLGTGAHLAALRRTRSGDLTLADALPLESLEQDAAAAREALIPMGRMLPAVAPLTLTDSGVTRACQGRDLGPQDFLPAADPRDLGAPLWRLIDPSGELVALAEPARTPGFLHPALVLR